MKKLYCEDKVGWDTRIFKPKIHRRQEKNLLLPLLFYFLLLPSLSAQININGFCKWNEINAKPGYNGIFPVDFNNDGYRDLLLYSNNENKIVVYRGDTLTSFQSGRETFFNYPVSKIAQLNKANEKEKKYVFLSRKSRTAGTISFTSRGVVVLKSKFTFNSYPSSLDIADIDRDGRNEILIGGTTFEGLSILRVKENKLTEQKIDSKRNYKMAKFIDLDYDGYPDIAALDVSDDSVRFFYNDQSGEFREYRSLKLTYPADKFKICDLNSDGFNDILCSISSGFVFLPGDSVSSFQNSIFLDAGGKPESFDVFDYNGDGLDDVSYYLDSGGVFVLFNRDYNKFYKPLNYFNKPSISALISFVDKKGKHLTALSSNGNIFEISGLKFVKDNFSLTFTPNPRLIGVFASNSPNEKNYFLIDTLEQSLIALTVQRNGIVSAYYKFPLSENYTDIGINYIDKNKSNLFCFSRNKRKIELFTVDFSRRGEYSESNNYTKRIFYTAYPIYDVKFKANDQSENQTIYALIKNNNKLLLQRFRYKDFRYVSAGLDSIGVNPLDAVLSFNDYPEIYWIEKTPNGLVYNKTIQQLKGYTNEVLGFVSSIEKTDGFLIPLENGSAGRYIPLMIYFVREECFVFYRKKFQSVKIDNAGIALGKNYSHALYNPKNKTYSLYSFFNEINRLIKYEFHAGDKKAKSIKVIESQNISSYFVIPIKGNLYLISSNPKTNPIEFKDIE